MLFLVSEMSVRKLKRTAVGFYQYSAKKVWIQESSSFTSTNVRKTGFFIRKDPRKANRDLFAKELFVILSALPLNAEISALFQEAKRRHNRSKERSLSFDFASEISMELLRQTQSTPAASLFSVAINTSPSSAESSLATLKKAPITRNS